MASFNRVTLLGNITRDPEIRYTPKGQGVLDLGMAMNRKYRLDSGEVREEVTYVDVTFWGQQAETITKWCKKGRPIFIEGRLQLDSWDDKTTGKKQSRLRVIGDSFQLLYGREGATGLEPNQAIAAGGPPNGGGGYGQQGGGYSQQGGGGGGGYPPQGGYGGPPQGGYSQPPQGGGGYPPQGGFDQGGGGGFSRQQAAPTPAPARPAGPPPQAQPSFDPNDMGGGPDDEQIPF